MIWLEMRTTDIVYYPGWNFLESVWERPFGFDPMHMPTYGSYSGSIEAVKEGDTIFHLKQIKNEKQFLGYSIATDDAYSTRYTPANKPYESVFPEYFSKVDLSDYHPLESKISLSDFFTTNENLIRSFFEQNELRGNDWKHLFFSIKGSKLKSVSGAYFTKFDEILVRLLLAQTANSQRSSKIVNDTKAGETLKVLKQRVGHQQFSDNVKYNYKYKCCFPTCKVEGNGFLVSGHIDRWADNDILRGHTANGLCLCLMHDKAFEKGIFTLNESFQVVIVDKKLSQRPWLSSILASGEGMEIKPRQINPLIEALHCHWARIGYV